MWDVVQLGQLPHVALLLLQQDCTAHCPSTGSRICTVQVPRLIGAAAESHMLGEGEGEGFSLMPFIQPQVLDEFDTSDIYSVYYAKGMGMAAFIQSVLIYVLKLQLIC